jgi:uncharacterized membrane protein YvbJ
LDKDTLDKDTLMICGQCTSTNQDGSAFCNQCGSKLPEEPPSAAYVLALVDERLNRRLRDRDAVELALTAM